MLSVSNTLGTSGASLSLDTRVAVGAGVFVVSAQEPSEPVPVPRGITTSEQKIPAYNAFEFNYRSDFGKVILLQQNVETGQEVTQVPTEYHLRQYAATQRAQRVQLQQKLYKGAGTEAQAPAQGQTQPQTKTVVVAKTTAAPSGPAAPGGVAAGCTFGRAEYGCRGDRGPRRHQGLIPFMPAVGPLPVRRRQSGVLCAVNRAHRNR